VKPVETTEDETEEKEESTTKDAPATITSQSEQPSSAEIIQAEPSPIEPESSTKTEEAQQPADPSAGTTSATLPETSSASMPVEDPPVDPKEESAKETAIALPSGSLPKNDDQQESPPADDVMEVDEPKQEDKANEDLQPNTATDSSTATATQPMETEPVAPSTAVPDPPMVVPVETKESVEAKLRGTFEDYSPRRRSRGPPKKRMNVPIRFANSSSLRGVKDTTPADPVIPASERIYTTAERLLAEEEQDSWGVELRDDDNALAFFEETHEEQDPAYLEFLEKKRQEDLNTSLKEFEVRDQTGRKEIEDIVVKLAKEKRESTDKSHQTYREKVDHDEKKEMVVIQTSYQEKANIDQQKISKGLKYLQQRQQKEVNMAHNHHQLRRLPESHAQSEWQKTIQALQAKHQKHMSEFTKKSEELRRKTNTEFKREQEKIRRKYGRKRTDVDARRDKIVQQQMAQFAQLKQRYLKRHLQKIMTERDSLKSKAASKIGTAPPQVAKRPASKDAGTASDKKEHRPSTPMKSEPDWVRALRAPGDVNDAITRQKHRKGVLSQTSRQLSIEIHNEGIWTLLIRRTDDDKTEAVDQEFINWGQRAYYTLESIVCGEIPPFYERINFGDSLASQGGQLRCSITDLRTSNETASVHRAAALREQEDSQLTVLEKKANELTASAAEAEVAFKKAEMEETQATSAVENAAKTHEKTKRDLEEFNKKFRSFLGPNGAPLPSTNPKNREELLHAIMRYKQNITIASNKAAQVHQKFTEIKNRVQRLGASAKTAQKHALNVTNLYRRKKAERAAGKTAAGRSAKASESVDPEKRISDIVASLTKVATKRRDNLGQKKSSSFSKTWSQSFPELSEAMKKSLWHKMVRRKQQIVLRPTPESLVNELREKVGGAALSAMVAEGTPRKEAIEKEMMKAEELLLLACHPVANELLMLYT
jgi:hypothetical protein